MERSILYCSRVWRIPLHDQPPQVTTSRKQGEWFAPALATSCDNISGISILP